MKSLFAGGISAPKFAHRLKFVCLVVAVLAAGCGKSSDKPTTQVAARVNGDEITVHQINDALARQNVRPEEADAAKRQVLERLIDQHLAKQQAVEKKLDRTPRVIQAIENAKNEILARGYLEQIAAAQAKPTAEDVKKYYADHPELFAQRRVYSIEEVSVSVKSIPVATLRERAARSKDMGELASWLKEQNADMLANRGVRAAENVPLPWLMEMHRMKDGEVRVFDNGDRLNVVRLVAARAAPVDEATAAPAIQQFLANQRLSEEVAKQVQQLRGKSNIEYLGEFAARGDSKPKAEPQSFQPASREPATQGNNPGFDKGVRGLMR